MKPSSQIGLIMSLGLFATAGSFGFWPQPRPTTVSGGPVNFGAFSTDFRVFPPHSARNILILASKKAKVATPIAPGGPVAKKVTLHAAAMPIQDALTQICLQTGSEFSIDPRLQGQVTVEIHDEPFDTAVRRLLHANGQSATCRQKGKQYRIEREGDYSTRVTEPDLREEKFQRSNFRPRAEYPRIPLDCGDL